MAVVLPGAGQHHGQHTQTDEINDTTDATLMEVDSMMDATLVDEIGRMDTGDNSAVLVQWLMPLDEGCWASPDKPERLQRVEALEFQTAHSLESQPSFSPLKFSPIHTKDTFRQCDIWED